MTVRYYSLLTAAVTLLVTAGCDQENADPSENANAFGNVVAEQEVREIPQLPEPVLDREALLQEIFRAASAAAVGADDREAQAELSGRQFIFRLPFACEAATEEEAAEGLQWSFDTSIQTLKVRAAYDISAENRVIKSLGGNQYEAVQGFWVGRPWVLTASCSPGSASARWGQGESAEIGLAQFFSKTDSRLERRSRPFEIVQKVAVEDAPGEKGLNLVLAGRLKSLADGTVIKCVAGNPDVRPVCVASVEFDRVTIENAQTQSSLAEWRTG